MIRPATFGVERDSDIPIILAYNQFHYESLHPLSINDIEKTKELAQLYSEGKYMFHKHDIPYLISNTVSTKRRLNENINSTFKWSDLFKESCSKNLLSEKKHKSNKHEHNNRINTKYKHKAIPF